MSSTTASTASTASKKRKIDSQETRSTRAKLVSVAAAKDPYPNPLGFMSVADADFFIGSVFDTVGAPFDTVCGDLPAAFAW